jgi:ribonuclease HI
MSEVCVHLYFDGCSKGNPGICGAGAVIYDDHMNELYSESKFVSTSSTNNIAEYTGLVMGLTYAKLMGIKKLFVYGDSQLVIKQMTGEYKVKSDGLQPLYKEATDIIRYFDEVVFQHVYRNKNKRADELANKGLICSEITL